MTIEFQAVGGEFRTARDFPAVPARSFCPVWPIGRVGSLSLTLDYDRSNDFVWGYASEHENLRYGSRMNKVVFRAIDPVTNLVADDPFDIPEAFRDNWENVGALSDIGMVRAVLVGGAVSRIPTAQVAGMFAVGGVRELVDAVNAASDKAIRSYMALTWQIPAIMPQSGCPYGRIIAALQALDTFFETGDPCAIAVAVLAGIDHSSGLAATGYRTVVPNLVLISASSGFVRLSVDDGASTTLVRNVLYGSESRREVFCAIAALLTWKEYAALVAENHTAPLSAFDEASDNELHQIATIVLNRNIHNEDSPGGAFMLALRANWRTALCADFAQVSSVSESMPWLSMHVPTMFSQPAALGMFLTSQHSVQLMGTSRSGRIGFGASEIAAQISIAHGPWIESIRQVVRDGSRYTHVVFRDAHSITSFVHGGAVWAEEEPGTGFHEEAVIRSVLLSFSGGNRFPTVRAFRDEAASHVTRHPNISRGDGGVCLGNLTHAFTDADNALRGHTIPTLADLVSMLRRGNLDSAYNHDHERLFADPSIVSEEDWAAKRYKSLPGFYRIDDQFVGIE